MPREVALQVGITVRVVQRILVGLIHADVVRFEKEGRSNRYIIELIRI